MKRLEEEDSNLESDADSSKIELCKMPNFNDEEAFAPILTGK